MPADQRLFFATRKYNPFTSYIRNFKPLAIFCGCTARFVSDLVGNPEDRFSHNEAHILIDPAETTAMRKGNLQSFNKLNADCTT